MAPDRNAAERLRFARVLGTNRDGSGLPVGSSLEDARGDDWPTLVDAPDGDSDRAEPESLAPERSSYADSSDQSQT